MMARLATWLEDRARAAIYRAQAAGVSAQFVKMMQAALVEGIAAGRYEAGGAVFRDAASSGAFNRYVLQLMLEPHPQSEELSYRIQADPQKSEEAQLLCEEINSDPLAIRLRMIPTTE
jgi:hypothetical protein